jgi:hypothetical protein
MPLMPDSLPRNLANWIGFRKRFVTTIIQKNQGEGHRDVKKNFPAATKRLNGLIRGNRK